MNDAKRIKIKFCGLQTEQDIITCKEADYSGFIVEVPGARRSLNLEKARNLIRDAASITTSVAVTTSIDKIVDISSRVEPDIIQLHFKLPEDTSYLQEQLQSLQQRYAIAIGVNSDEALNRHVLRRSFGLEADYMVIEAASSGEIKGGSGEDREWLETAEMILKYPEHDYFIAGGLKPSNVRKAIEITNPTGIDTSSGIENQNGSKSPVLVRDLINSIRRMNSGDN